MIGIVHLLTGAGIGAIVSDLTIVVALAFFSHYLLDLLPHIDPETFTKKKVSYTTWQFTALSLDAIAVALVTVLFYLIDDRWVPILVGGVAAQLPDWLTPFEKYKFFEPLKKMHRLFHWDNKLAKNWSWYTTGIVTQATVSLVFVLVILWI